MSSRKSGPGTNRHSSPHPIVTRYCAVAASSGVKCRGFAWLRSMPISRMTSTTSGWTRSAGWVPAGTACALAGSASRLKNAAAICERPALCTHAKMTVFRVPLLARSHGQRTAGATARATPPALLAPEWRSCKPHEFHLYQLEAARRIFRIQHGRNPPEVRRPHESDVPRGRARASPCGCPYSLQMTWDPTPAGRMTSVLGGSGRTSGFG